jgi:hypothetical protein
LLEKTSTPRRDYRYVLYFEDHFGLRSRDREAIAAETKQQIQGSGREGFQIQESSYGFVSMERIRGCADRFEYRFRKVKLADYFELRSASRGGFRPTGKELRINADDIFEKISCPAQIPTRGAGKVKKLHYKYWEEEEGTARLEKALDQGYRLVASDRGERGCVPSSDETLRTGCRLVNIFILMREEGSTTRYDYSINDLQGLGAMQKFVPPGETQSRLAMLGEKGFWPVRFRLENRDPAQIVFERILGSTRRFQYRVTEADTIDEFLSRLTAAYADGFRVVRLGWSRSRRHLALSARVFGGGEAEPQADCTGGGTAQ